MATNTSKLNLIKPDFVDVVDVSDLNSNMDILDNALAPTNITTPAAGEKLVFDGTNWVNLEGYVYVDTVYFTSSGTFTKADYPWLRAIKVKCQGAGGGGGGAVATSGSDSSAGSGGGGGAYAESFITDIAGLDASVTVTRGAGGAGGVGAAGNVGGASSFGALVSGGGGAGGQRSPALAAALYSVVTTPVGGGSTSHTGDFEVDGSAGHRGVSSGVVDGRGGFGGNGGSSFLGASKQGLQQSTNSANGSLYGGGGPGSSNPPGFTARTGGAGANGIVIVELYA